LVLSKSTTRRRLNSAMRNILRYADHPTKPFSSANYSTASISPAMVAPPYTALRQRRRVSSGRRSCLPLPGQAYPGQVPRDPRSIPSTSAVFGCSGCAVRIILRISSQSPLVVRTSCGFADIWASRTPLRVPCEEEQPTGVRRSYTLAPVDYSSKIFLSIYYLVLFFLYSYYKTLTRATFPAPLFGSHVHWYLVSVVRRSVEA